MKRFTPSSVWGSDDVIMVEHPEGRWVDYQDYEKLGKKVETYWNMIVALSEKVSVEDVHSICQGGNHD